VKRLAAIIVIVTLVLAVTAGPAFASACPCGACADSTMSCSVAAALSCQTPMSSSSTALGSCDSRSERIAREGTVVEPGSEHVAVASALTARIAPAAYAAPAPASIAPDARGAPHLTAVLRI
jgi:hypothetical protein